MKKKVGIVVITFNRLEFLKEIINALRDQTLKADEIIVVNNSSTDGTKEWLEEQKDLTVITQENVGSSGGQNRGFKEAFKRGHEWIWVMDDDVVPAKDCLENLLFNEDKDIIRAPLRYNTEGNPFINDTISFNLNNPFSSIWIKIISERELKNKIIEAEGITFEGPLIHRSVIETVGYPEIPFFIYGDDSEYFIRSKKAGFKSIIVSNAKLYRKLPTPNLTKEFSWKNYYILRNLIAIDVLHGTLPVRIIRPFAYLFKWLIRSRKLSQAKTYLKAFANGYFYKSRQ